MRFSGIWIQRGQSLVRSQERGQADEEFVADYDRLYMQGHFVLLVPGKNYDLDELFFFETAAGARHFYDGDLSDFECFIGDEREPCGFQEVSLYIGGHRVATKSVAPSPRFEVSYLPARTNAYRVGTKIVEQNNNEE